MLIIVVILFSENNVKKRSDTISGKYLIQSFSTETHLQQFKVNPL